ncbi:MAG: FAD-dependent oxidoreductase [Pseudonocardiaceae bacterium]
MPRVLIIGGGIAGTAAALALGKAAIDATVYEAHPLNSQDGGAFLTLASNGMQALRQLDADDAVSAVIRGSAAFGYIVTAQPDTWWFCRVTDTELSGDEITSGTTPRWKAALITRLQDDQTRAAGIVRSAHQILVTNAYDLPDVPRWHRDHLLVIGDAAHAASPATGQGASMALEDAVILAKSLRDAPDPASAFVVYEQLRRDRVQANIIASARMSAPGHPGDRSHPSSAAQRVTHIDEAIKTQLHWRTPLA